MFTRQTNGLENVWGWQKHINNRLLCIHGICHNWPIIINGELNKLWSLNCEVDTDWPNTLVYQAAEVAIACLGFFPLHSPPHSHIHAARVRVCFLYKEQSSCVLIKIFGTLIRLSWIFHTCAALNLEFRGFPAHSHSPKTSHTFL